MSHGRQYPPPPGLDRPGASSRLPPPPSLRSEPYRPSGPRNGGGGGSRGRDRSRGRGRGGWNNRDDDRSRNGRADSYHPLPPRPSSPQRNGNIFREGDGGPAPPRGDFTFRAPKPAGVYEAQQRGDSYQPRNGDRDQRYAPSGPRSYQQNRSGYDRRGDRRDNRRARGGRFGMRFMAADRPILHQTSQPGNDDASQDFAKGAGGITYLNFDELSDSDEAEMDISGDEGSGDGDSRDGEGDGKPARKRARLTKPSEEASVPKWSNPDPYTVLPPTETGQKKKDVVHLIRKARVRAEQTSASAPADTEEFISCDMDSESGEGNDEDDFIVIDDVDELDGQKGKEQPGTGSDGKSGTGSDGKSGTGRQAVSNGSSRNDRETRELASAAQLDGDRTSDPSREPKEPSKKAAAKAKAEAKAAAKKAKAATSGSAALAPAAAVELNPSRKRTHDDQFKLPDHAKLKRASTMPAAGFIVPSWQARPNEDGRPWLKDHSDTAVMATWLHKEIFDFYDHVKPREFEQRLRQDLIDDLERAVRKRFSNAKIFCFGSFMSGLYLPTGDMDIVMCSTHFLNNRPPVFNKKGVLYKFGNFLCMNQMADREHLEHISKAKVPLVKYVDIKTWLKVDVSFENMTGVAAVRTFTKWREQYPAMPVLVTLVKQFLTMRGLNEPVNGGIGGFSMICLVVSMLQLMPQIQSQDMKGEHHLGDLLMHFFDLYGNKFNYEATAISLSPPGYVPKSRVTHFVYKNVDRLSIIDPNNPQNDIAGGSRNTPAIMRAFADAHEVLRKRMLELASLPEARRHNESLLGVVLEGDYSAYREQREHLRDLYRDIYGTEPSD